MNDEQIKKIMAGQIDYYVNYKKGLIELQKDEEEKLNKVENGEKEEDEYYTQEDIEQEIKDIVKKQERASVKIDTLKDIKGLLVQNMGGN